MDEWKGLAATILWIAPEAVDSEATDLLSGGGWTLEQLVGGEDGRTRLLGGGLDLVIVDLAIEGVAPLDLIADARRGSGDPEILVLAGADEVDKAVEALEAGASHYVTKPVNPEKLAEVAARLLDNRRLLIASNIAAIVHRVASTTDVDRLPPRVIDAALLATRAKAACVYLWDDQGLRLVGTTSKEAEALMRPVAGEVLAAGEPVQTVEEDEGPILAWPMIAHSHGIGVLVVRRDPGDPHFGTTDEQQLSIVATEAALSLDRARLIEDLRHQVDALAHTRHQLAAAEQLQGVGELATGYAHELTGPIQYLQSHLRGLESALESEDLDEARSALGYALDGANRIQSAVSELSLLGRQKDDSVIDSGRLFGLARRMALAGSVIEVDEDIVDVSVQGNVGHLVQALAHLLRNAVRACGDVVEPVITLRVRASGGEARFEVIDNGSGLDPDLADRIFEPFVSGWDGHSGMGLGVARQIAEDAGGEISVRRHDDGGVVATLTLPTIQDESTLEIGDD